MDPETTKSARALFLKHAPKAESAVLIETDLFPGMQDGTKEIKRKGESPYAFGAGVSAPSEKVEKPSLEGVTVGVYLVFHNESEGHSIDPEFVAMFLSSDLPGEMAKCITKVSLIACNSADDGPRPGAIEKEQSGYVGKSI